jgi:toxin YoeB
MEKVWSDRSWKEYLHWQTQDKKTLKKINNLIKDIERNDGQGIGKPEQLQGDLSGWSSRRIDEKNRPFCVFCVPSATPLRPCPAVVA